MLTRVKHGVSYLGASVFSYPVNINIAYFSFDLFPFFTPWKRQETSKFLEYPRSIENENCPEMG